MTPPEQRLYNAAISRRDFLRVSAGVCEYAIMIGIPLKDQFTAPFEQADTMQRANVSNKEFLAQNKERLKHVRIGCSFAPEEFENSSGALYAIALAVKNLGMRDIRLGIRWSKAEERQGIVDIGYYIPFLDYCITNDVNVCLNTGPIKTFRWPEEHIPQWVIDKVKIPKNGAEVTSGSPLGAHAIEYTDRLFERILAKYGKGSKHISIIQPDNEPFNRFGVHRLKMGKEYLTDSIERIQEQFPHANILLNSGGAWNIDEISKFFEHMMHQNPKLKHSLIMGIDYYYKVPGYPVIPLLGMLDSITAIKLTGNNAVKLNKTRAQELGYQIEVTEAQAEPWGKITSPGNSAQEFKFMLLRCIENILEAGKDSVIRMWGIEHLLKKMIAHTTSKDHEEIFELVQAIQRGGMFERNSKGLV